MRLPRWILAFAFSLVAGTTCAQSPFDTYFLAVGSTSYIQPGAAGEHGFETLPGANASARLVADILARGGAAGGIVLTSGQSAYVSRADFTQALAAVGAQMKAARPANPLLVVYFAGHGISEGIAWNHFSVPGNFVYGASLDRLDIEAMARHTIHAAGIADEIEKLGVPYLLLLDTCYAGTAANFRSPVFSATAIRNLSDVSGILRFMNEFHQPNPVIFSARPGTEVPLAPDPRNPDRQSLGPLARRLLLLSQSAGSGNGLRLSALVSRLTSPGLDTATSPPVTNATAPTVDGIVLGPSGSPHAAVAERQGTATGEDSCCGSAVAPAAVQSAGRLRGSLSFAGPRGEFISGGRRITLPANTEAEIRQPDSRSVEITFAGSDGWELDLSSPDAGGIGQRRYSGAQRYPFQDNGRPGLSLTGAGKACNDVTGDFTIGAIQRDAAGKVTTLAADFSQACDGAPNVLRGSVRLGTP